MTRGSVGCTPGHRLPSRPALEIVTAARIPPPAMLRTGTGVFDAQGDVTVDCDSCGWHAQGPRAQVRLAQLEHRRMFHAEAVSPLVTILNRPGQ